jgi:lysozyme
MIKGIDVSHYQGDVDWPKVKADGVNFVFIKATQGVGYSKVDYFRNHAPKAAGFGLHVGLITMEPLAIFLKHWQKQSIFTV